MSSFDNDQIIQKAYEELQRFYANDELREKVRERQQFLIDYHLGMNAAKQEGREEGREEGCAKTIVAFLEARFGLVPESISDAVRAINDLEVLNHLTKIAAKCESLAEFENALKKP